MAMETGPFEDVFPIENGDTVIHCHVSLLGGKFFCRRLGGGWVKKLLCIRPMGGSGRFGATNRFLNLKIHSGKLT